MSKDLYDGLILELADKGGRQDPVDDPDREATATNPLCGDRVTVGLKMDGDAIRQLSCQVRGCLLCRAACATLADLAPGLDRCGLLGLRDTLEGFLKSSIDESAVPSHLQVFAPVRPHRSRHRCVLLPYEAALKALADADG